MQDTPKTTQLSAPPLLDAIRLWQHVFGERPDLVGLFSACWVGRNDDRRLGNWQERFFRADQFEEAATWVAREDRNGRDCYFAVAQLLAPQRIKNNAAPSRVVHADMDGAPLDACPIRPTAVVETSPGHFHAYWRLSRLIQPQQAEELNRRLVLAVGADKAAVDSVRLMRCPGTHNRKRPGEWADVQVVWIDDERTVDPNDLDQVLPKLPEPKAAAQALAVALSDDDEELLTRLSQDSPTFRKLWTGDTSDYADEHGNVDRSDADWGLIQDLLRATGDNAERTERLARQSPLVRPKWDEPRAGKTKLRYTIDRALEQPSAGRSPAIHFEGLGNDPTTWPEHIAAEPGPTNGKCSDHCARHLQREVQLEREVRELREQNALRAALFRRSKEELKPADKLVGVAILNLQASLESRGETGRIPVVIEAEPRPEREQWIDTSLTAVVGMSDSTVRRSLERLAPTTGGGLWEREYEPYVTSEGLQRSRLVLKPADSRPAAEQWKEILTFTPPDEDNPAPRRELIRCKRHPFVKVNKETTWRCTVCGRHAKEPRSETLDPCEVEPPALQNDRLVNGFAEPGQVPGRDIWAVSPALQFEGLGTSDPLPPPVDVRKGRHSEGLASEAVAVRDVAPGAPHYWPVYDRAPIQPVVVDSPSAEVEDLPRGGHACQDCGAFGDEQWGEVVLIGPPGKRIWLHAGLDAPCHDRSARVGGAA